MIAVQPQPTRKPYTPRGAAMQIMHCTDRYVLTDGPVRTGKTLGWLEKVHLFCSNCPGARALLVRKTRASMTTSVLQTFEDDVLIGKVGAMIREGPGRAVRRTYHYPNGSTIDVAGLDKPERLMSTEYDIIVVFEATEITLHDFEMLATRLTGKAAGYRQLGMDCNPGSDKHWLWQAVREGRVTRFASKLEDNPRWYDKGEWTHQGRELVEALDKLTGARLQRLRHGRWASAEGQVYDTFDTTVHVVDSFPIPDDWKRYRAIDFGYTNPFVCLWGALSPDDDLYIYRELYGVGRIVSDWAKDIKQLSGNERYEATIADHDAEDRATLDREGICTIPADKAVLPGIQAVQERLVVKANGKPSLMFMRDTLRNDPGPLRAKALPTCLLDEIDGYIWAPAKDGKQPKEEPLKRDDHAVDALRYLVKYLDLFNNGKRGSAAMVVGGSVRDNDRHWTRMVGGGGTTFGQLGGRW